MTKQHFQNVWINIRNTERIIVNVNPQDVFLSKKALFYAKD